MTIPKLYTLDELIPILKVSRQTLYNCIKDGRLKANKVGRSFVITEENLNRFINGDYDNGK